MGKTKKIKAIMVAMAVAVTAFMPGCSFVGMSDNDLLKPPKATGEKAEIQKLIESNAGVNYSLVYPQSGDYRSAIIMQDIDGDSADEAIAFCKTGKNSLNINIMFIKKVADKWTTIKTFDNVNSDVDRVYFSDVDNNGRKEVIVGWSSYLTGGNQITMYSYAKEGVTETMVNSDAMYTDMTVFDITNDGVDDLIVLTNQQDKTLNTTITTARLYSSCIKDKFSKVSEIKTNPNIIGYSKIQQGYVNNNVKGLFLDGLTSNANEQITEVLYFSQERKILVNLLDSMQTDGDVENITKRNTISVCKDVDGDGIIEVPSPYTPVISDTSITPCSITKWYKIDSVNETIIESCHTVASYSDGFYFILPKEWENNIVAVNDNSSRVTSFYQIISVTNSQQGSAEVKPENSTELTTLPEITTEPPTEEPTTGISVAETDSEPLLTLKVFTDKSWESEKVARTEEGYTVIKKEAGLVYTCKLGKEGSNLSISTDQVSNTFKMIN